MKQKSSTITIILMVVLIAILSNQALWVYNMYDSYKKELIAEINMALEKAALMEVTERGEKGGGFFSFALYPGNGDTSRFIQRTLQTVDTTIVITIDRHDPNVNLKIGQFILDQFDPIDLFYLNDIFNNELSKGKFHIKNTYLEFYSLSNDSLRYSTKPDKLSPSYLSSNMILIDIMNTMGLKAFVESPAPIVIRRMIIQLVLSGILLIISIISIFYIRRTIYIW